MKGGQNQMKIGARAGKLSSNESKALAKRECLPLLVLEIWKALQ